MGRGAACGMGIWPEPAEGVRPYTHAKQLRRDESRLEREKRPNRESTGLAQFGTLAYNSVQESASRRQR